MKSVKQKIMVSTIALVTVSLIILGSVCSILTYTGTMSRLEQDMTTLVEITAERVRWEMEADLNVATELGCMKELTNEEIPPEEKVALVTERAKFHGLTRGVILDAEGKNISTGVDMSDREYFKNAMRGKTTISEPVISRVTGEISIIIAAPLWENGVSGSTVVGCVYVVPHETFLNDIVSSIHISDSCVSYILDAKGNTIAHKDITKIENSENLQILAETDSAYEEIAAIHDRMEHNEHGYDTCSIGGISKIAAFAPIANTNDWSLIITADTVDFQAEVR